MSKWLVACLLSCFLVSAPSAKPYNRTMWEWDQVTSDAQGHPVTVTGYRIYYTYKACCVNGQCSWSVTRRVDIPASHCGLAYCHSPTTCCGDFLGEPPGGFVFFIITAYNQYGESGTGHGPVITTLCP